MKRSEKKRPVDPKTLPPIRIKKCPPTIDEAIVAAQGLADDVDAQVEIAAGFMGVAAEDVRPLVIAAAQEARSVERRVVADRHGAERAVIVERARPRGATSRPAVVVERARPAVVVERRPRIQLAPRVRTFDLTRRPSAPN
jgi:hypothetical protein